MSVPNSFVGATVQLHPKAGVRTYDIAREALILCLTEQREVMFAINGTTYKASPEFVLDTVFKINN